MLGERPEIIVCKDMEELARKAAGALVGIAEKSIEDAGAFRVALTGGKTPKPLYRLLASDEFKERVRGGAAEVFWGDERAVGPDDPESNFRMALELLLGDLNVPREKIHRIEGEKGPVAASLYEKEIRRVFKLSGDWKL